MKSLLPIVVITALAAEAWVPKPTLGLDLYLPAPSTNPLTRGEVAVGRRLFFAKRLSRDGTLACASLGWQITCDTIVGRRDDMASVPLTEEQVTEELVVLNLEKVGLSDDQFIELCSDNRDLHLELTAQKELLIMPLPGAKTGRRNEIISTNLAIWAKQNGTGVTFAPSTPFHLPNGAKRAPDASWVRLETWDAFTDEQQEKIPPLCPDFVVELMSPSDRRPVRFRMLREKMDEYIANGAQLGWLIDPFEKNVYIYRPGKAVECLKNPATLYGDPILPGFVFQITEVWQQ